MSRHARDDDYETMVIREQSDPWHGLDQTQIRRTTSREQAAATVRRERARKVYGRVYEVFTDRPEDGPHPYVGQVTAPKTIAQRVDEHRSRAEVARFPWKAHILPGKAGYRCIKVIYATGDPAADEIRLDLAEAIAIDELRTTHNGPRPIRPRHGVQLPPRPADSRRPRTAARRPARKRPFPWRALMAAVFMVPLFLVTLLVVGAAVDAMALPYAIMPAIPWMVALPTGVFVGNAVNNRLLRWGKRMRLWT